MTAPDLSINHYLCPPGYGTELFMEEVAAAGASGVGLTLAALAELGAPGCRHAAAKRGLAITSLNSASNLTLRDPAAHREANRRLIDAAAELQALSLNVITGGLAGQPFGDAPQVPAMPIWSAAGVLPQVEDGLAWLVEQAGASGVQVVLEPIHPMNVLFTGVVTSIAGATAIAARIPGLGLMLDVYHSWWDADLAAPPAATIGLQVCGIVQADAAARPDRDVLGQGIVEVAPLVAALRARAPGAFVEFEMFDRHRRGRAVPDLIAAAMAAWRALPR